MIRRLLIILILVCGCSQKKEPLEIKSSTNYQNHYVISWNDCNPGGIIGYIVHYGIRSWKNNSSKYF